jgi:hypothetical protein
MFVRGSAVKNDGAKQQFAYVQAVRKQGGKLIIRPASYRHKDAERQAAATKAALNKNSN